MNELSEIKDYGQFKEALGTELRNQAEGFVRTGYLLKVARDTDILKESGYTSVAEFALAEYGLSKDIVSRYIAINDRYSKDGYSEYLQEQYEGYGVAKLQEMLTLPDSVVELMSPDMTRREIQDIKQEIRDEEKISDMEVLLEGNAPDQEHMTTIQKAIHRYFYEEREQFVSLKDVIENRMSMDAAVEKVMDVIAPSGMALKTVRVQGLGKLMISIKGKEYNIEMLNVRSNEKEIITWQQFLENMMSTFGGQAGEREWETVYGEPFKIPEPPKEEKKPEVAPVQPKKESKPVESVAKPVKNVSKQEESVPIQENVVNEEILPEEDTETAEEDVQVPGQTNLEEDFPEYMPEKVIDVEVKDAENVDFTESEDTFSTNVERGYKAAVTNNLNTLKQLWEGTNENKISLMLDTLKDLQWRLEKLKQIEGENA